ncbi:hypothetical protein ASE63_17205 [Bosea sp. Root381]|nr:hypothetical protein ASE63_17205 [Bosea sp. Root381]
MIALQLREFVDLVLDRGAINIDDVKFFQRDIVADAVLTRDDIDVLIALDRAVPRRCEAFADLLVALTVDFAVWQNRPTGYIDRDKAYWLVTTLSAGEGPTPTARRIAAEIVREAEGCDETLLTFAFDTALRPVSRARRERRLLVS